LADTKRLLIVSGSFPEIRCGVARHVDIIASGAVRLGGYEVEVLTSADEAVDAGVAQGYQVHARIAKWGILSAGKICGEILRLRPDIVHIQNPTIKYCGLRSVTMSAVVPLLKKKAPQVRVVVTQHDIAVGKPMFRRRYKPLLKAADAVTVSNERDYQAVLDLKIVPEKVYVGPVGSHIKIPPADSETRARAREALAIPADAVCITYFGFVHPERNVDVIIRALDLLRRQGRKVHGVIMGGASQGPQEYYQNCKELAGRLRLEEDITWTGYATEEQIIDGMRAGDVFVSLPQRGADMRNTSIHTALLAEMPVVTTRNERYYVDELMEKMGCVCVAPRDAGAVSEAIIGILENPPPSDKRARLREQLDPDRIWDLHVQVNARAYENEKPMNQPWMDI
jgi:glycosyltransferase involved in cell wall biosynthesis